MSAYFNFQLKNKCKLAENIAKAELNDLELKIITFVSEKNMKRMEDITKGLSISNGGFCQANLWNMKKKFLPKPTKA